MARHLVRTALSKQAPEAADLYLLLSADGDYGDMNAIVAVSAALWLLLPVAYLLRT
jgi:hypothetical protein